MFPASPSPAATSVERLLVRSVNWLGDAVMTTPALLRLREAFPRAHIALLGPAKLEKLWLHHPAVDAALAIQPGESAWSVGRRLRRGQYDVALILPNSPRSALETFLAGIPRRVAYARPCRNWLLTHPIPPRPEEWKMHKRSRARIRRLARSASPPEPPPPRQAHHIFQYLHLAAALGASPELMAPQLALTETELAEATRLLSLPSSTPPFWLGLNPGAEYGPAKRWPEDRYAAAARELHRQTACGCVLVGAAADLPAATRISDQLTAAGIRPVLNLAGQTTLRELCAVLATCRVLLTNDSGPMHVAAAVGTPVVVPFGSTAPELTGPGLPGSPGHALLYAHSPCSPCFHPVCPIDSRCLTDISAQQVTAALLKLATLKNSAPGPD